MSSILHGIFLDLALKPFKDSRDDCLELVLDKYDDANDTDILDVFLDELSSKGLKCSKVQSYGGISLHIRSPDVESIPKIIETFEECVTSWVNTYKF